MTEQACAYRENGGRAKPMLSMLNAWLPPTTSHGREGSMERKAAHFHLVSHQRICLINSSKCSQGKSTVQPRSAHQSLLTF